MMKVLPHLICLDVLLVPVLCQTGLSVADKEAILNVHNAVRRMVTVASNMQHMVGYGVKLLYNYLHSLAGHTLSQERVWYFTMQRFVPDPTTFMGCFPSKRTAVS